MGGSFVRPSQIQPLPELPTAWAEYQAGGLPAGELLAVLVVTAAFRTARRTWLQGEADRGWRLGATPWARFVATHRLYGVSEAATRAIGRVGDGSSYRVRVCPRPPSEAERLAHHARGFGWVTFSPPTRASGARSGLEALVRDLEQLDGLCDYARYNEQVGLLTLVQRARIGPRWASLETMLGGTFGRECDALLARTQGPVVQVWLALVALLRRAADRVGRDPSEALSAFAALLDWPAEPRRRASAIAAGSQEETAAFRRYLDQEGVLVTRYEI